MTDQEQPTSRLDRLGAEAGPLIDPAFANRLETDLRMAMAERAQPAARPWWQPVLVGVASLLVLLAAGAAVLTQTGAPSTELVMSAASDTEVILPDGALADGVAGLELPDGTRISVGAGGQAVVDGVVLPPGSVAVIANGRLELLPTTTSTVLDPDDGASESSPSPSSGPATTATDAGEDEGDEVSRSTTTIGPTDTTTESTVTDRTIEETDTGDGGSTTSDSPTTTAATTTSVPSRPTTTSATSPPSTSTTATDRTTTEVTRPTTVTTAAEAELEVTLDVDAVGDTRLRLTWSLTGEGPDVLGFEVQVLAGPRLRTVLLVRDGTASTATVERLEADVGYRVRAIGADGEVLATSRVIPAP